MNHIKAMKQALNALKQIDDAMPFPVAKHAMMQLRQAIEQAEQAQPVAWIYTSKLAGNQTYITRYASDLTTYKADKVTTLYTSPPTRKPLTDEEIKHAWYEACKIDVELTAQLVVCFARAIEASHGIKEKNT